MRNFWSKIICVLSLSACHGGGGISSSDVFTVKGANEFGGITQIKLGVGGPQDDVTTIESFNDQIKIHVQVGNPLTTYHNYDVLTPEGGVSSTLEGITNVPYPASWYEFQIGASSCESIIKCESSVDTSIFKQSINSMKGATPARVSYQITKNDDGSYLFSLHLKSRFSDRERTVTFRSGSVTIK